MANTSQDFAALVAEWRGAVAAHKAACDACTGLADDDGPNGAARDAACEREALAAAALATAGGLHPILMRGHAEMLDSLAPDQDPLTADGSLLRNVAAALRAFAADREGSALHPVLAMLDAANAAANRHDQSPDSPEFDAACDAVALAAEAVMRCPDLEPAVLARQVEVAGPMFDRGDPVSELTREAFERNTRALAGMVERCSMSPVMQAASRAADAATEYERLDAERDAMFTGPGGTDEGLSPAEVLAIDHRANVVDRAAHQRRAWDEVVRVYPARDLGDAAIHVVSALSCVDAMVSMPKHETDYIEASRDLPRLLWSALGALPVDAVPFGFLRFHLGNVVNPWTGKVMIEGGQNDGA